LEQKITNKLLFMICKKPRNLRVRKMFRKRKMFYRTKVVIGNERCFRKRKMF